MKAKKVEVAIGGRRASATVAIPETWAEWERQCGAPRVQRALERWQVHAAKARLAYGLRKEGRDEARQDSAATAEIR